MHELGMLLKFHLKNEGMRVNIFQGDCNKGSILQSYYGYPRLLTIEFNHSNLKMGQRPTNFRLYNFDVGSEINQIR